MRPSFCCGSPTCWGSCVLCRYGVSREALQNHRSLFFTSPVSASAHALRPANDHDQFVGISDQAKTLAERVKAANNNQLKVFSIVGFGGLGKTTLAMEVCRQLEAEFYRQAQVSVSQAFDRGKDLRGLLKRVLQQIVKPKGDKGINEEDSVGNIDGMDLEKLHGTLKELLADKRWIAEGLVAEKRGMTLIEVAETYFDELMSRSMIVPTGDAIINDADRETCQVHDMMLVVMVSKSLEANFVSLVGGQYQGMSYASRIHRLSVHGMMEQGPEDYPSSKKMACHTSNSIEGMDVQHVRSLSMFELNGKRLFDRLREFTLLRVLDLSGCKGLQDKHMEDICQMYLLRFLSLRGTDISEMPQKVGKLEHLQTLDVRGTYLQTLPATVAKLHKLERLFFNNRDAWSFFWLPPHGLSKMNALREVATIGIEDDIHVAREIGDLEQLRSLCIYVDSHKSTKEVYDELAASLGKTCSLRSLNVGQTGYDQMISLNFLLDIKSPPRLLRYLRMAGGIDELPNWVGSLACLVEFDLSWGYLVDDDKLFGVLCKAPNLKRVSLKQNFYKGRELVARTSHNFPALTNLGVTLADEFPEVFRVEEGSMTKLEKLSLRFCGNKDKTIDGINHLRNLKEVRLGGAKNNPSRKLALERLKAESESRPESEQFKV